MASAKICTVCEVEVQKYRCPQCEAGYCCVECFKTHKPACSKKANPERQTDTKTGTASTTGLTQDAQALPAEILDLLRYDSLRSQLALIAKLQEDASISNENTTEGRQIVALKKLRELRKGGREANELVEEFCQAVMRIPSLAEGSQLGHLP